MDKLRAEFTLILNRELVEDLRNFIGLYSNIKRSLKKTKGSAWRILYFTSCLISLTLRPRIKNTLIPHKRNGRKRTTRKIETVATMSGKKLTEVTEKIVAARMVR